MGREGYLPLFETKRAKGRTAYKLYAASVFVGICLISFHRVTRVPTQGEDGRWAWIGMFMAELWFSFYWFVTQHNRWNPIYRRTFKDRLSQRFEGALPGVDIFVCTADPEIEPPIMVANTVLSVMAYDYPPEKMAVYLSDDGGSESTFYAMLEASRFARHWIPFCRKFKVEPRSPDAYFCDTDLDQKLGSDPLLVKESSFVKKLYEDMSNRVNTATRLGQIPEDIRKQHKGFCEWDLVASKKDHPAIVQILIDGRKPKGEEIEVQLPSLVYLSREKRPQYHHNFKAGAVNALIRVSSKISNSPIILNLDCDMYSNNSESVRDALCFFMDEEQGHQIAFVQYPQCFHNQTRNDIYGTYFRVIYEVELPAMDSYGGPCYIGTGCFHRRDSLCGMKYSEDCGGLWKKEIEEKEKQDATVLEETCKIYASCTYEENTPWGKERGLKYGFAVEDIATGLSIQSKGWKSVFFNPERIGFIGTAPATLLQSLVQMKRWSEGQFQIFLSKYGPLFNRRLSLKHLIAYAPYNLWAPNCLPTLYYVIIPTLFLLRGISLFPKISNVWVIPFTYVFVAKSLFSLGEFLCVGGTVQGWWNEQRMWLYRRTASFLFGFLENISSQLGFAEMGFVVTSKVADEEINVRYKKEVIEFGAPSLMFAILATIAMLNLISFGWVMKTLIVEGTQIEVLEPLALQIVLCGLIVLINLPLYHALFFRKDEGRMPASITIKSIMLALLASSLALY